MSICNPIFFMSELDDNFNSAGEKLGTINIGDFTVEYYKNDDLTKKSGFFAYDIVVYKHTNPVHWTMGDVIFTAHLPNNLIDTNPPTTYFGSIQVNYSMTEEIFTKVLNNMLNDPKNSSHIHSSTVDPIQKNVIHFTMASVGAHQPTSPTSFNIVQTKYTIGKGDIKIDAGFSVTYEKLTQGKASQILRTLKVPQAQITKYSPATYNIKIEGEPATSNYELKISMMTRIPGAHIAGTQNYIPDVFAPIGIVNITKGMTKEQVAAEIDKILRTSTHHTYFVYSHINPTSSNIVTIAMGEFKTTHYSIVGVQINRLKAVVPGSRICFPKSKFPFQHFIVPNFNTLTIKIYSHGGCYRSSGFHGDPRGDLANAAIQWGTHGKTLSLNADRGKAPPAPPGTIPAGRTHSFGGGAGGKGGNGTKSFSGGHGGIAKIIGNGTKFTSIVGADGGGGAGDIGNGVTKTGGRGRGVYKGGNGGGKAIFQPIVYDAAGKFHANATLPTDAEDPGGGGAGQAGGIHRSGSGNAFVFKSETPGTKGILLTGGGGGGAYTEQTYTPNSLPPGTEIQVWLLPTSRTIAQEKDPKTPNFGNGKVIFEWK